MTIVADVHGTSHDRRDVRACSARRSEGVPRVAKWGGSRVPRMLCKTRPHDDEKVQISVPRRTTFRQFQENFTKVSQNLMLMTWHLNFTKFHEISKKSLWFHCHTFLAPFHNNIIVIYLSSSLRERETK